MVNVEKGLTLLIASAATAAAATAGAQRVGESAPNTSAVALPVGTWKGTSRCLVRPSACNDEVVVYRLRAAAGADSISLDGAKVVDSGELEMGVLSCGFDRRSGTLACEMPQGTWRFTVRGDSLVGGLHLRDGTASREVRVARASPVAAPRGRLLGVYDEATGEPLEGVQVVDGLTGTMALTSSTGTVWLTFLSQTASTPVEIRKIGYQPKSLMVATGATDTVPITLTVSRVTELPTVPIVAAGNLTTFAGFNYRCSSMRVTCIKRLDLAMKPSARLSDFLVRADGVRGRKCPRTITDCTIEMYSSHGGRCIPTFFVDGFPWKPMLRGTLTEIETIASPTDVKGIEVYRAEQPIPPRFDRGDGCGAVVIWTR
jgi:hypothetical protein